jgi:integrase
MSKVKYNLRKPNLKSETVIMMVFHFNSDKLRISTGRSILPKYWNNKNQRAKEIIEYKEHYLLNQHLENQAAKIINEYNQILDEVGYVDKNVLKDRFLSNKTNKEKKKLTFWGYFEEFIIFKRKELGEIKDYNNSLRKHVLATEKKLNRKATFESIKKLDNGFIEAMENYLTFDAINAKGEKGLAVNTIGKQFKNLKVFLNWCFDREYIQGFSTKHIKVRQEVLDEIYLTKEEVDKLFDLKINNSLQQLIRDCFILGCETSLRISDLKLLKEHHISKKEGEEAIRMEHKKTKNKVVIPLSKRAFSILKKHNFTFNFSANNDFNSTIKEICKKAKIDTPHTIYRTVRNKRQEFVYKKYELVSSHTCRRTFCTLKVLDGIPVSYIRKISGHNSERTFFRYLKMDNETAANEMRKYM